MLAARWYRIQVSIAAPFHGFRPCSRCRISCRSRSNHSTGFVQEGLKELLEEISPITDHHRKMELYITDPRFEEPWKRLPTEDLRRRAEADPRVAEIYCRERDMNYAAPLCVSARLVMRETGEIKETGPDGIFLGDFPMMTTDGTFIINGAERVVVSQLVRSPGVYFEVSPGSDDGQACLDRQADPEPRRLARVRDVKPRRHLGQGRPQAQDAGHDPAPRHRPGDGRSAARSIRRCRHQRRSPLHPDDDGEGADEEPRRGSHRALSPAAPGRSADAGQRLHDAGEPVLQRPPVRPGPRWPLQAESAAASRQAGHRRSRSRPEF